MTLHKIRNELQNKALGNSEMAKLSQEFFSTLHFKAEHRKEMINNRRVLSRYYDLCQILRDMINIGEETDWNLRTSVQSIYRSIGTFISCLNERSAYQYYEEVQSIEALLRSSYEGDIDVLGVYEVVRPNENADFNRKGLGNVQLLFHGSRVSNFVGILSRGLLLPKFVSDEKNNEIERSDEGLRH